MALDLTTLKTLRAVIETGSFAAAARDLGYTASAVSQQMAGLERALGLELFTREPRRVVPTEAAEYLKSQAGELFRLMDQLHVDIGRWAAGQVGHLRIGTFASGGPMVAEAMTRFLVKRRDVEVSLDEGEPYELFPRVENGELDVALGFQYDLAPRVWAPQVQLTAILDEELLVVASRRHRLAGKDSVDLTELRHERWVAHRVETAASDCLAAFCGKEGFAPNITFRTNNLGTVRGIVAAGSGVAMISELAHIDRERIIALPITQKRPSRQIVAATRDRYSNPLADAFLDAVRQVSRESVGRA
jgi:DNA-binding transcriptional LysR family regulator